MKRRHRGQGIAEYVRGPDGTCAVLVNRVDKAVRGGQEARGHAGPEREDGKGEEVGKHHRAAHGCVDAERLRVVEARQEGDRRRYVGVRVYPRPARYLVYFASSSSKGYSDTPVQGGDGPHVLYYGVLNLVFPLDANSPLKLE